MNTDDPIEKIVRRFGQLKAGRGTWETHWREIAERVLPRMDGFGRRPTPGEKHTEKQFDATAALALERFAAAMDSMLTPRASRWHRLAAADPSLNEIPAVRSWFDEVTALLFAYRYAPAANFAAPRPRGGQWPPAWRQAPGPSAPRPRPPCFARG